MIPNMFFAELKRPDGTPRIISPVSQALKCLAIFNCPSGTTLGWDGSLGGDLIPKNWDVIHASSHPRQAGDVKIEAWVRKDPI